MHRAHRSVASIVAQLALVLAPALASRAQAEDLPPAPSAVGASGAAETVVSERERRASLRLASCQADPRVMLGQVSLAVCLGADLFFRETFDGNGRTCGSCHPADNNYTIDPAFIAQLPDSDALFVAERNEALAELELPELLREGALILVNPDGLEDPTHKFVMRSVSHMLGLATSTTPPRLEEGSTRVATDGTLLPPLSRLGWGGDGAPGNGELRDFADGAIIQHMTRSLERREGTDFRLPTDAERDSIAAFSGSIGRMNEVEMAEVALSDRGAERGRLTFLNGNGRECAIRCHVNAGANSLTRNSNGDAIGGLENSSFDIGTALVRLGLVDDLSIPLDAGFGKGPHLDLDGDGELDSFGNGGMNVAPLIEAADTAPMFHSNAFATLEDAIGFYASQDFAHSFVASTIDFDNRGLGEAMPLTTHDIREIGRFLRVLNTSLNCQMAAYRLRAATEIAALRGNRDRDVQVGLLNLAEAEIQDALEVLGAVRELNPRAQRSLRDATRHVQRARAGHTRDRLQHMRRALERVTEADRSLGCGLNMQLGQGTLMF
jgi:cytochrome c peroxidase